MFPLVKNLIVKKFPLGDVTQWFGENPDLYARFKLKGHNGIDIIRPHGEVMYALEDCEVVSIKEEPEGFGKNVRFLSTKKDKDGNSRLWVYGHNSENLVTVGQILKAGDPIAKMGNTGFVVSGYTPFWQHNPYAGTHCHLGLRYVKRVKTGGFTYSGSTTRIEVQNYDNGYKGSVDPYPVIMKLSEEETEIRTKLLTINSLANTLLTLLKLRK